VEIKELHDCILKALPDAEIYIKDLTGGGDHFEAFIISASFEGQNLVRRHQTVLTAVKELMAGPLHAFTFKTHTPTEWEKSQTH